MPNSAMLFKCIESWYVAVTFSRSVIRKRGTRETDLLIWLALPHAGYRFFWVSS